MHHQSAKSLFSLSQRNRKQITEKLEKNLSVSLWRRKNVLIEKLLILSISVSSIENIFQNNPSSMETGKVVFHCVLKNFSSIITFMFAYCSRVLKRVCKVFPWIYWELLNEIFPKMRRKLFLWAVENLIGEENWRNYEGNSDKLKFLSWIILMWKSF